MSVEKGAIELLYRQRSMTVDQVRRIELSRYTVASNL